MTENINELVEAAPAWLMLLVLAIGIVLLLAGGTWLVEGSVRLARRAGVSTLFIGLTIVAFGTSSPELAFNITAAINGNGDLSFGNVVGSNIANIALVLGIASLIAPLTIGGRVIKKELPLLIFVTLAMVALGWLPPRIEGAAHSLRGFTLPDGLILLGGFALVTHLWYRAAKQDKADPFATDLTEEVEREPPAALPMAIVLFVTGLFALVVGGKLTEVGAVAVARWLGLSQSLIGLTVVAVATSLPELVTSAIACRKGHGDLAVGNVIGSNLFNILLVLGATSVLGAVPVPEEHAWLGVGRGWWDMAMMLFLTLVLLPIALTTQNRVTKTEGVFLLLCYFGYMAFSVISEFGMR